MSPSRLRDYRFEAGFLRTVGKWFRLPWNDFVSCAGGDTCVSDNFFCTPKKSENRQHFRGSKCSIELWSLNEVVEKACDLLRTLFAHFIIFFWTRNSEMWYLRVRTEEGRSSGRSGPRVRLGHDRICTPEHLRTSRLTNEAPEIGKEIFIWTSSNGTTMNWGSSLVLWQEASSSLQSKIFEFS